MTDVFWVADQLIAHARRYYADEVAVVVYYGSYAKGTASATSDLDLYFIPDSRAGYSLGTQFVLDGLPYDFWPVSWQMAEGIATGRCERPWSVAASLIADAKLLYARSPQDRARFEGLQGTLAGLLTVEKRPFMQQQALAQFCQAEAWLAQLRLAVASGHPASLLHSRWELVNSVANCLALAGQTYFSKGWGANLAEVLALPNRPEGWEGLVRGVLETAVSNLIPTATTLVSATRRQLYAARQPQPTTAAALFTDFYYFIFEYRNKVVAACRRGDKPAAQYAALQLQQLVAQLMHQVQTGIEASEWELLGDYLAAYQQAQLPDLTIMVDDLDALAAHAQQFDQVMRHWLQQHRIPLNRLENETTLTPFLQQRQQNR